MGTRSGGEAHGAGLASRAPARGAMLCTLTCLATELLWAQLWKAQGLGREGRWRCG